MHLKLHSLINQLLLYVMYPLWLVAGAFDYWCHRRTNISATSGIIESSLHVAQFLTIAVVFICAVLLEPTIATIAVIGVAAVLHLVLSYVDVAYTHRRRYISPLEQHVHGFLDVLPIIAVCLLAVLVLNDPSPVTGFATRLQAASTRELALLIGTFVVVAGGPVVEEFLRTATNARAERKGVRHAEVTS
jgi:hypothetical protein